MDKAKIKVLDKLFANGYTSEKKLQGLSFEQIIEIEGLTVPDMKLIKQFQDAIKTHTIPEFLSDMDEKKKTPRAKKSQDTDSSDGKTDLFSGDSSGEY